MEDLICLLATVRTLNDGTMMITESVCTSALDLYCVELQSRGALKYDLGRDEPLRLEK